MKKSRKKTIYITILRYIFRGTLFWSIFGALRAIGVYDVTNQNFGLTMLKVLFCCLIMGLSICGLITIDRYFARRIDRLKAWEVAEMAARQGKPCINCAYRKNNFCGKRCEEGVEQWLKERI